MNQAAELMEETKTVLRFGASSPSWPPPLGSPLLFPVWMCRLWCEHGTGGKAVWGWGAPEVVLLPQEVRWIPSLTIS